MEIKLENFPFNANITLENGMDETTHNAKILQAIPAGSLGMPIGSGDAVQVWMHDTQSKRIVYLKDISSLTTIENRLYAATAW